MVLMVHGALSHAYPLVSDPLLWLPLTGGQLSASTLRLMHFCY